MTKLFEFETADGTRLDVDVSIECRDRDGADFNYEIEWIGRPGEAGPTDSDSSEVSFESLSDADKLRLNKQAEDLAYEYANEAYQSYAEGAADAAYDRWKDDQMERGE